MENLIKSFNKLSRENPLYGSYICLAKIVTGKNLSMSAIGKTFNKVMLEKDFDYNDRDSLINHLHSLSKNPTVVAK